MSKEIIPITATEALDTYYGGLAAMSKSTLPFVCVCKEERVSLKGVFEHIRKDHKERIKLKV